MINSSAPTYSLRQLTLYFFRLGYAGFGGPVALVGYMHRDLVESRGWISEDQYREGLALSQLAPGPLAAQLGMYLGFVHHGVWGALLTGGAFVLPSFLMVVVLGVLYKAYGGIPWMQAAFYGVGAAVIGIIAISTYRLTVKSISQLNRASLQKHWLLWILYAVAAVVTIITESESVWVFLGAGLLYMMVKAAPSPVRPHTVNTITLLGIGFWEYDPSTLGKIALFFIKAGSFVFGSGLAIVPFLQGGVVKEYSWLTEHQFLDAVAVAMITPGPVVITVAFIGYLVAGFPGAVVAAAAIFLPCYLITIACAPHFKRIAQNRSVKAFVDGITAAVIGALLGAVVVIATRSIVDIPTALIAAATLTVLLLVKKVQEPVVVGVAALVGIAVKLVLST